MEWDTNAGKKNTKGYTRESKKALVKPDHLRLWGTGTPLDTAASSSSSTPLKSGSKKSKNKRQTSKSPKSVIPTTAVDQCSATSNETTNTMDKKYETPPCVASKMASQTKLTKTATFDKSPATTTDQDSAKSAPQTHGQISSRTLSLTKTDTVIPPVVANSIVDDTITVDVGAKELTTAVDSGGDLPDQSVSPKSKPEWNLIKSFEAAPKRSANEIQGAIQQLSNKDASSNLQEAILRAKHTEYHLEKAMHGVGADIADSDSPLAILRSALTLASPYKKDLDDALLQATNFKSKVYDILKTGDASAWVATVTKDILATEMNGDANRLYQLLMEGKKWNHLELVDAATLCAAADRKDLFSTKQLQTLCERSAAIEVWAADEARKILVESEKQQAAEDFRQRATLMDRGVTVRIHGLTAKSDLYLNGKLATYMGLGQGQLYILRLYEGKEIALDDQNFHEWDGCGDATFIPKPTLKPTEWACQACTYLHEGTGVDKLISCSMCGHAKTTKSHPQPVAPKIFPATHLKNAQHVQQTTKRHTQPVIPKIVSTTQLQNAQPVHYPSVQNLEDPMTKPKSSKPKPKVPRLAHRRQKKPSQVTSTDVVESGGETPPVHSQPSTGPFANPVDGLQDADVKAKATTPGKTQRCKFGKSCHFLKHGKCRNLHSMEEAEYAATAAGPSPKPSNAEKHRSVIKAREGDVESTTVKQTIYVESKKAAFVVGKKRQNVKDIMQQSGATIYAEVKKSNKKGMFPIYVRGPSQIVVDKAVLLLEEKAKQYDLSCQQGKVVSNENDSSQSKLAVTNECQPRGKPVASTTTGSSASKLAVANESKPLEKSPTNHKPSATSSPSDLRGFLECHAVALKCTPSTFLSWLNSEDIKTVYDLDDALKDDFAVSELLNNGLKKFKLGAFRRDAAAATKACASAN